MIPLYYAFVAFSNLSMVSTVMGLYLERAVAARGSQLYMSVQNSAVEDPSFNARNYITEKRGNHGLGMKRVAAVVDKYGGFLNLANEPGVFAAEVSLPL